jgi:hypothetical protein
VANVRRTMRVVLNGEKFEVQTNALDLVHAERDGQGAIGQGLRTAHQAAIRMRLKVPPKFDTFLEQIDSFDDLTDDDEEEGLGDLDPTQKADSATSP